MQALDQHRVHVRKRTNVWVSGQHTKQDKTQTAYIRGWEDYLNNDPTPAHTLMKQVNPNNTDDFMNYSRKMIIDEKLVTGRQGGGNSQIGRVSKERFQVQIHQLEELKILPKGKITVDQVVTTAFLP